ncbi:hypothetical protein LALCM10_140089 [Dellaglioa algida]|nr:hypothetical protein LALCM10_140089 [Dellaglioa algida]
MIFRKISFQLIIILDKKGKNIDLKFIPALTIPKYILSSPKHNRTNDNINFSLLY